MSKLCLMVIVGFAMTSFAPGHQLGSSFVVSPAHAAGKRTAKQAGPQGKKAKKTKTTKNKSGKPKKTKKAKTPKAPNRPAPELETAAEASASPSLQAAPQKRGIFGRLRARSGANRPAREASEKSLVKDQSRATLQTRLQDLEQRLSAAKQENPRSAEVARLKGQIDAVKDLRGSRLTPKLRLGERFGRNRKERRAARLQERSRTQIEIATTNSRSLQRRIETLQGSLATASSPAQQRQLQDRLATAKDQLRKNVVSALRLELKGGGGPTSETFDLARTFLGSEMRESSSRFMGKRQEAKDLAGLSKDLANAGELELAHGLIEAVDPKTMSRRERGELGKARKHLSSQARKAMNRRAEMGNFDGAIEAARTLDGLSGSAKNVDKLVSQKQSIDNKNRKPQLRRALAFAKRTLKGSRLKVFGRGKLQSSEEFESALESFVTSQVEAELFKGRQPFRYRASVNRIRSDLQKADPRLAADLEAEVVRGVARSLFEIESSARPGEGPERAGALMVQLEKSNPTLHQQVNGLMLRARTNMQRQDEEEGAGTDEAPKRKKRKKNKSGRGDSNRVAER